MLDKIIEKAWDSADKALQVGRRVDKHDEELSEIRADVKALQEALNEMGDAIRYLNDRLVREQERNADRHENMLLRLENALLRAGIGAPPLPVGTMALLPESSQSGE